MVAILYVGGIVVSFYFLDAVPDEKDYYLFVGLILIVNMLLIIIIGHWVASSIAYPYSNSFIRRSILMGASERFGMDFVH